MASGLPGEHGIRQGLGWILAQATLLIDAEGLEQSAQEIGSEDDGCPRSDERLRRGTAVSNRNRRVLDGGQLAIGPYTERGVVRLNQVGILSRILILVDDREDVALQSQTDRIAATGGKRRAVDGLKAVGSDAEHRDRIGARVDSEQKCAFRIDNQILVGIERAEGKGAVKDADSAGWRTAKESRLSTAVILEGKNGIAGGAVALEPDYIRNSCAPG